MIIRGFKYLVIIARTTYHVNGTCLSTSMQSQDLTQRTLLERECASEKLCVRYQNAKLIRETFIPTTNLATVKKVKCRSIFRALLHFYTLADGYHSSVLSLRLPCLPNHAPESGLSLGLEAVTARVVTDTEGSNGDGCDQLRIYSKLSFRILNHAHSISNVEEYDMFDITLCTQLTIQRVMSMKSVLENWSGPIILTFYLTDDGYAVSRQTTKVTH